MNRAALPWLASLALLAPAFPAAAASADERLERARQLKDESRFAEADAAYARVIEDRSAPARLRAAARLERGCMPVEFATTSPADARAIARREFTAALALSPDIEAPPHFHPQCAKELAAVRAQAQAQARPSPKDGARTSALELRLKRLEEDKRSAQGDAKRLEQELERLRREERERERRLRDATAMQKEERLRAEREREQRKAHVDTLEQRLGAMQQDVAARDQQIAELAAELEKLRAETELARALSPAPPAPERELTPPVIVSGAASLVAIGVGTWFGANALATQSELGGTGVQHRAHELAATGRNERLGANIAFGTAAVAGTAAVLLYLFQ